MSEEKSKDIEIFVTGVSMSGKAEVKKDDTVRRVEADQKRAENTETNDSE
jgi:hypothetical protein